MHKTALKTKEQVRASQLGYDKAFQQYNEKLGGDTKYENRTVQKKKRQEMDGRESQSSIIMTSQSYGWREPIDNIGSGFARVAVCDRTFMTKGHL